MRIRTLAQWAMVLTLVIMAGDPVMGPAPAVAAAAPVGATAMDLLQMALEQAQAAGSYRLMMDVQQTIAVPVPVLGDAAPAEQSARIRIEGQVGGPQEARLTLTDGNVRGRLPQSPVLTPPSGQEVLVAGGAIYQREGDAWIRQPDAVSAPGLSGDALMLLKVAKGALRLGETRTLGGTFERVGFALDSRDVLAFMLSQSGSVDPDTRLRLQLSGLEYSGTGEVWIDDNGLPARLALNLSLARGGADPYGAYVTSITTYSNFGESFPTGWFDPTRAPLSRVSTSPIPGSGLTQAQVLGTGLLGATSAWVSVLLFASLQGGRHRRRAYGALSIALVIALLGPSIAQAAAPADTTPSVEPSQPSAVETMLLNARDLSARQQARVAAQAGDLEGGEDEDGDSLPNGYELALGTNPFAADSDLDGLTDAQEVLGVPCATGTTTVMVETDPLNPDSNADGIRDGDEAIRGMCRFTADGNRPPAWDDDNDSDGVPDDLDLSPFSASVAFDTEGANLSFETLASLPGIAPREVYYFELQMVPDEIRTLQYAYKSALEWPVDDKGLIQHDPNSGTTGMLEVAPFLEVTLDNDDLPGDNAMAQYGVGAAPVALDDGSPSGESTMVIPLAPIERGGVIYALQAKVFQDHPSADGIIRWRDARLKWAVQGDVLRADDDGAMVPSPTGGYGLVIYDEPYRITGVQTSRQGGAASLVAGAIRTGDDSNAAPVALLRGALEAQYLGGRLQLSDIYARFNQTSSAPITERWGITQTFGVSLPAYFQHMDEMLLTTNVTTTRGLLNTYYPAGDVRPTLLIATEQRTATLNADDLASPNFADLVLNVCVTEMVTSRTLKLATYEYDPTAVAVSSSRTPGAPIGTMALTAGDWTMLGLDEVLADIKAEFDALYGTLEDAYNEAVTMLQMAMTVWYQGQTVVQAIGDLDLTNVTDALGDAAFYANILGLLDQVGLFDGLPSEFRVAVEFLLGVLGYPGGPAQWFEDQWNSVVTMADEVVGSFKDYAAGDFTPGSLVSFTQTGINVLTWLASIFDFGFLGDAVKVLSRLLEIFTKVQQLWNTIQVLATQGVQVVSDVLKAVTGELTSLAGNLQFVGLILSVFTTLFSMFIQLAAGALSVLGVIGVILKAVIEIAIAVVLFVVSTLFPIGTLVAIGIALIKLVSGFLKDYLGDVGAVLAAILDPIGAILEAANPDPEPLATFLGSPRVGPMQFRTFPDEPLGGLIAGDRFGFEITGTVTMAGSAAALNRSSAWLQLGRYATGDTFELCGLQILQYLTDSDQLDQVPGYTSAIVQGGCRTFRFDREPTWSYARNDNRQRSGIYFTDKVPGTEFPLPGNFRVRDYETTARLIVDPHKPQINGVVSADVTLDVRQLWENCGVLGIDCDVYVERYETSPSAGYVYFDILPRTLVELWEWEDLTNHDPDADGLAGNLAQGVLGFDNGLCGNPNAFQQPNSEPVGDRLTDTFELFHYESSPCLTDTDSDNLNDYEEFILGTSPREADTDGDGLKDGDEIARWNPGWLTLSVPWRVDMGGAYPSLPNPAAFPNPRIANADRDARSDRKEKMLFSSPNAFNVSDIEVAISQELVEGGGTEIRLTGFPWPNDLAPGLSPVLTMTLPISLNNVTTSAHLVSKGFSLTPGTLGTPVVGTPANVYTWTFSPLTLNRLVQVTLSGLPASIPAGEVFLTVDFSYTEAGVARLTSDTVPLLINRGGPETTITTPSEGSITSALSNPIRIQGIADDPEGVGDVEVCITSATSCGAGDWEPATVGSLVSLGWTFDWTPPTDGSYRAFARGVDAFGVAGPTSAPIAFFVDSVPPSSGGFDLDGTTFVSSTAGIASLAAFTVTGQVADGAGAYVSGVGGAQVTAELTTPDGVEILRGESVVASPGAPASAFHSAFSLPMTPLDGAASPYAQGLYQLNLSASDRAGNVRPNSDTLSVIVDDTAPFTFVRVPQTVLQSSVDLGGRADDIVLSPRRLSQTPYPVTQTLTTRDTAFNVYTPDGRAYAVGDLNGDTVDDVVVLTWDPGKPLEAGIFFGRTAGFPDSLDLTQPADVALYGETDGGPPYTYGPTVATNTPGLFDVNGDGIADLLIGDPNVALGEGRAYLLLGRRTWPRSIDLGNADWRLSVSRTIAFGGAVASAGDIDGDGLTDLLVGAATNGIGSEVLYLYLGRERGVPPVQSVLSGRDCRAGCPSPQLPNLAGLGDTDGDGLSDVSLAGDGVVWLIGGRPKDALPVAASASDYAIATLQAEGQQQTVAPAGDVNGDGFRDMLIGDPLARFSRVFVLFGRPPEQPFDSPLSLVTGADLSFLEPGDASTYPPLGLGLAPMGDLDRDGKDDFAFGGAGPLGGVGIVLSGRVRWQRDQSPDLVTYAIFSSRASFEAGAYLSSGDVNGDAIRDVLLGMPGANAALLFNGKSPSLMPSGISRVEVGLVGPITEPWKPITETVPTVWQTASLDSGGAAITTFSVPLTFASDGDYRIYARATDRAGNRLPLESWYVGTTFVNRNVEAIATLAGALDAPALFREGFLRVRMTGSVTGTAPIQSLRIFDGERWTRMPLLAESPGGWSSETNIARSDLRTITFRAVARDGLGNIAHVARTVTTDTLVAAPALLANLPTESWSTNITPTLVITWPAVADLGGPVTRYASIDRVSDTVPTTPVGANQVSRALDAPGAWYAHVRVVDSSGNEQVVHDGPYGVNRTRTPSAILPDGTLDFYGAEYTEGMATSYDPYAAAKPALLLATWDAAWLYLGFTGSDWTPEERLVIYLDTKAGGSTASLGTALPGSEPTHALPFSADFALVVHDHATATLFEHTLSGWVTRATPVSYAATAEGTEIAFSRGEIGALGTNPVSLLAYVATAGGVTAVIPAGARTSSDKVLTGSITFTDAIRWDSLRSNYPTVASDLPVQRIAPLVSINPGQATQLNPGEQAKLVVAITNPDILPYDNHRMTVTLGSASQPLLAFASLDSGAVCVSCPSDGREWVVSIDVGAEETQSVAFVVKALAPTGVGLFTAPVTATLAYQGLPLAPQPPATASYTIDRSVAQVGFAVPGTTIFAMPGLVKLPIFTDLGSSVLTCKQQVSINRGNGWEALGALGAVSSVSATLPSSYNAIWQLQVVAPNGLTSTTSVTVQTDDTAPTAQVSPTPIVTQATSTLRGTATDSSGRLRAVEVSLNRGPFRRAIILGGGSVQLFTAQGVAQQAAVIDWAFPVQAGGADGEILEVVVRAIDAAGNVGSPSTPVTVALDTVGPIIVITESLNAAAGSATDGSGVAQVQISLDGGLTYQDATLSSGSWSFDYDTWSGGAPVGFVTVRAVDVHSNATQAVASATPTVAPGDNRVYLPLVTR